MQFRRGIGKDRRDRIDPGTHEAVVQAAAVQEAAAPDAEAFAVVVAEPWATSQKKPHNGTDERGETPVFLQPFLSAFGSLSFVKMLILLAVLLLTHLVFATVGWGIG